MVVPAQHRGGAAGGAVSLRAVEQAAAADAGAAADRHQTRAALARAVRAAIAAGHPVVHVARAAQVRRAQAYVWRDQRP